MPVAISLNAHHKYLFGAEYSGLHYCVCLVFLSSKLNRYCKLNIIRLVRSLGSWMKDEWKEENENAGSEMNTRQCGNASNGESVPDASDISVSH